MSDYPQDIYTEPQGFDVDTLANLGPLRPMAGIWQGERGLDVKPKAEGPKKQAYVERIELQPIDPQTNGPQLLYGLRYHTHITKPGLVKTYHDQVGYWLWEPATGTVIHTLTIPRGQTAMASGTPLVGLPLHGEQELNVALAVRQGMAVALSPQQADSERLTQAVQTLVGDPQAKRQAQRVRDLYARVDGAARAAEEIDGFLKARAQATAPEGRSSVGSGRLRASATATDTAAQMARNARL